MSKNKFTPPHPLKTAVLFLIFNRLDTTKQVFEAIKKAKPPRLYIAADGARASRNGEDEKAKVVREYVMNNIDWDCEVKTLFREKNLGCKYAVSGAIDWFFENEEMGIILEDDCLPSQSFFWFCDELLERYNDTDDIYLISGDGRATSNIKINEDYSFTKYPLMWGWASWKRVWKNYDVCIKKWPSNRASINNITIHKNTKRYWGNIFEKVYNNQIDTWDYQFSFLLLLNNGKCIVPKYNLITNIGFGSEATHTFDRNDKNADIENYELKFPLVHPEEARFNNCLNEFYDKNEFHSYNLLSIIINKLSRFTLGRNIIK